MSAQVSQRGRGRPALTLDNKRVAEFLRSFREEGGEVEESVWIASYPSAVQDILCGAAALRTDISKLNRFTLRPKRLLLLLESCDTICTEATQAAVSHLAYSLSHAKRLTAAMRVASKAIAAWLDRNPAWDNYAPDSVA